MSILKPQVETRIIPYIFYRDVRAALDWLAAAFGFVETEYVETPNGGRHGEMSLDGQGIMMGQSAAGPVAGRLERATQGVFVWIGDADAHFARAEAAGAEIVHPPKDLPYGRSYAAYDLDGHPWYFTTPSAG